MLKNILQTATKTLTKPLENQTTKAMDRARAKALGSWRELVELAHRDKAQPEEWILQRLGADLGIHQDHAAVVFSSDVQDFDKAKRAVANEQKNTDRVQDYYLKWDTDSAKGYDARMRLRVEELNQEMKELQQEKKFYRRDVTNLAGNRAAIQRVKTNTRLFPDGELSFTEEKEPTS